MIDFGSLKSSNNTICEIEIMHTIRKGQIGKIQSVLFEVKFINEIMV